MVCCLTFGLERWTVGLSNIAVWWQVLESGVKWLSRSQDFYMRTYFARYMNVLSKIIACTLRGQPWGRTLLDSFLGLVLIGALYLLLYYRSKIKSWWRASDYIGGSFLHMMIWDTFHLVKDLVCVLGQHIYKRYQPRGWVFLESEREMVL